MISKGQFKYLNKLKRLRHGKGPTIEKLGMVWVVAIFQIDYIKIKAKEK